MSLVIMGGTQLDAQKESLSFVKVKKYGKLSHLQITGLTVTFTRTMS